MTEAVVKKSEVIMREKEKMETRAEADSAEGDVPGGASGSGNGAKDTERAGGSKEEQKPEEMEVEKEKEPDLESAPEEKGDVRVPLEYRKPAEKRARSRGTPGHGGKWQVFEKEDPKRGRDEVDKAQSSKWRAVEDTGSATQSPTDSVSQHPGPKIRREDVERGELE